MDPNWWPWHGLIPLGMFGSVRMSKETIEIPPPLPKPEENVWWKLVRGINLSATIALGVFVWQQYQIAQDVKAALVTRAAVVEEEIRQMRESIDSRMANLRQSQHDTNEQQDKRIDAISGRLDGHIGHDEQRFRQR